MTLEYFKHYCIINSNCFLNHFNSIYKCILRAWILDGAGWWSRLIPEMVTIYPGSCKVEVLQLLISAWKRCESNILKGDLWMCSYLWCLTSWLELMGVSLCQIDSDLWSSEADYDYWSDRHRYNDTPIYTYTANMKIFHFSMTQRATKTSLILKLRRPRCGSFLSFRNEF